MGVTEKQLKRYSARARRRRRLRRLTLLMLVLAAAFLLIDRNFRPLVFSLAEARSAAMATRALNGALTEALEDGVECADGRQRAGFAALGQHHAHERPG